MRRTSTPYGSRIAPPRGFPAGQGPDADAGGRSFAALLAEAEAVRDRVELQHRAARQGVPGALRGAAGYLLRQWPWMGLPLLLRRPAQRLPLLPAARGPHAR